MPILKHPTSPSATVSVSEDRAVKLRKRGYTDVEPQAPADVPDKPVDDDEAIALAQKQAELDQREAKLNGDAPDPSEPTTDQGEKSEKSSGKAKAKKSE